MDVENMIFVCLLVGAISGFKDRSQAVTPLQ